MCYVCVCAQVFSHVQLSATPWTVTHQTSLSMAFFRQEYWSGMPFPTPGIFLIQGSLLCLLCKQADSLSLCHLGSQHVLYNILKYILQYIKYNILF